MCARGTGARHGEDPGAHGAGLSSAAQLPPSSSQRRPWLHCRCLQVLSAPLPPITTVSPSCSSAPSGRCQDPGGMRGGMSRVAPTACVLNQPYQLLKRGQETQALGRGELSATGSREARVAGRRPGPRCISLASDQHSLGLGDTSASSLLIATQVPQQVSCFQ